MKSETFKRRKGKFYISEDMVQHQPDAVRRIMSKCIIVRCEYKFMYDKFEYHAYSPLFEILPEGQEAPTYIFTLSGYRKVIAETY